MTTNPIWLATLNSSSPNYEVWRNILDQDDVPLKRPTPAKAILGVPAIERTVGSSGCEENVEVYVLDLSAFSQQQFSRLVAFVSAKYAVSAREVEETLRREGFPIRCEDVIVAFSMRAFL